jgi:hypothetical protein
MFRGSISYKEKSWAECEIFLNQKKREARLRRSQEKEHVVEIIEVLQHKWTRRAINTRSRRSGKSTPTDPTRSPRRLARHRRGEGVRWPPPAGAASEEAAATGWRRSSPASAPACSKRCKRQIALPPPQSPLPLSERPTLDQIPLAIVHLVARISGGFAVSVRI